MSTSTTTVSNGTPTEEKPTEVEDLVNLLNEVMAQNPCDGSPEQYHTLLAHIQTAINKKYGLPLKQVLVQLAGTYPKLKKLLVKNLVIPSTVLPELGLTKVDVENFVYEKLVAILGAGVPGATKLSNKQLGALDDALFTGTGYSYTNLAELFNLPHSLQKFVIAVVTSPSRNQPRTQPQPQPQTKQASATTTTITTTTAPTQAPTPAPTPAATIPTPTPTPTPTPSTAAPPPPATTAAAQPNFGSMAVTSGVFVFMVDLSGCPNFLAGAQPVESVKVHAFGDMAAMSSGTVPPWCIRHLVADHDTTSGVVGCWAALDSMMYPQCKYVLASKSPHPYTAIKRFLEDRGHQVVLLDATQSTLSSIIDISRKA